jgi:hypothetical protein
MKIADSRFGRIIEAGKKVEYYCHDSNVLLTVCVT